MELYAPMRNRRNLMAPNQGSVFSMTLPRSVTAFYLFDGYNSALGIRPSGPSGLISGTVTSVRYFPYIYSPPARLVPSSCKEER